MEHITSLFSTASTSWAGIEPKWPVYVAGAVLTYAAARLKFSGAVCKETADLTGKTIFITGATSGIGIPTAAILAKMGKPRVVIAARDLAKGAAVVKQIIQESGNDKVELVECDLSDFDSVRSCAKNFTSGIDILILNAGLTTVNRRTTKQGHEMMVGSMHLGHALLTHLLLPRMPNGSRIVVVGSHAHKWGKIDLDDMKCEKYFSAFPIYSRAKLCNLHFTRYLAKLLREQNRDIVVNCCHPGFIASGLSREGGKIVDIAANVACLVFGKTAERGAQTTVYAAISKELKDKSGLYLSECRPDGVASHVTEDMDKKLWDWTLQQLSITDFG